MALPENFERLSLYPKGLQGPQRPRNFLQEDRAGKDLQADAILPCYGQNCPEVVSYKKVLFKFLLFLLEVVRVLIFYFFLVIVGFIAGSMSMISMPGRIILIMLLLK